MNVLYILGNGFDKAQGMHTSYPEFYQYLMKNTDNGSALLQQLKQDINADKELWSDMEEALGHFTSKVKSANDFDSLYFELSDHLQDYLKNEEKMFNPTEELKTKFIKDFIFPFRYLGIENQKIINDLYLSENKANKKAGLPSPVHSINVMTLNYTNTLERLLLPADTTKNINSNNVDYDYNIDSSFVLRKIIHVHGILNDSIIIGVDNIGQISNEQFRKNADIRDLIVKEQSNHAMGYTCHEQCENLILEADIVVLYGVSLGDTDARWWQLIGNRFRTGKLCLIQHIFKPNDIIITPNRKQWLGKIDRERRNFILNKMMLYQTQFPDETKSRLFFVANSSIFQLKH